MRFRLCYRDQEFDLVEGEFAIGRNASCQLVLEDGLVSRRHAILTVSSQGVAVEDLNSRNGVTVNGERLVGLRYLMDGDVVQIGSEPLRMSAHELSMAGVPLSRLLPHLSEQNDFQSGSSETEVLESSMLRRANQVRVIGTMASKALALGRAAEAERLLASSLADVIEASRQGKLLQLDLMHDAALFSARLATATGKGGWADYVAELYAAQGQLPSAEVIEELHHAYRKVASFDTSRLREYVELLGRNAQNYGPREQFVYQRLVGLVRLVTARS
jgi:hypothetical protein